MPDPYVNLAQKTIETFIKDKKVILPSSNLSKEMLQKRAGVFVTLHLKSNNQLRGCIGTIIPTCKNIASEIIQNAISSAIRDPRFPPIIEQELNDLKTHVDVLSEPILTTEKELNPKKYGLIVETDDGRQGLLLPDIKGVDNIERQIAICKEKGFIDKNEPVTLYKFEVKRHK